MAIQRLKIENGSRSMATTIRNVVLSLLLVHCPVVLLASQQAEIKESEEEQPKSGYLVQIKLPIDGRSASDTRQSIMKILDQNKELVRAEDRPIVVLELDNKRGATGQGSSLGACIDLARFLTGPELKRIKTVAYIPGKMVSVDDEENDAGQISGHAVLVALAANQIAIHPDARLGAAGIDEQAVDAFVLEAYRNVASQRLTIQVPVALAMLDKSRELFRTKTENGPVYVDAEALKKLESEVETLDTVTLSTADQWANLTGTELAEYGLIRSVTPTRAALARQLDISLDALKTERNQDEPWNAIHVQMPDYVDETTVQWISRALDPKIASGKTNLVIFEFDSSSGDVDACLMLARKLGAYDPNDVRTVAFVNKKAAGPAAMVALSCFHVIMQNDGTIGGDFEPRLPDQKLEDTKQAAAGIAEFRGRDIALVQAMIAPELEVFRYRNKNTGEERLMTELIRDELADAEKWLPQAPQDFAEPVSAANASKLQIARQTVSSIEELKSFYQLENDPERLQPTSVDRWLHRTALFLASPFVAPWLLFIGMFMIFNEVSQPGLGVPGFLGTLCLILYFWSQHLGGNANWLEILLFCAGVIFLLLEMFVVPGFGVFGIGGLIMVVISIVLASQTFVFPTTAEQFNQLPKISRCFGRRVWWNRICLYCFPGNLTEYAIL